MRRSTTVVAKIEQQTASVVCDESQAHSMAGRMTNRHIGGRMSGQPARSKSTQSVQELEEEGRQEGDAKGGEDKAREDEIGQKKWKSWSANATSTPFPDFAALQPANAGSHTTFSTSCTTPPSKPNSKMRTRPRLSPSCWTP